MTTFLSFRSSRAAVGPATAEATKSLGLTPDIVSKGHIVDLAESLTDLFGREG